MKLAILVIVFDGVAMLICRLGFFLSSASCWDKLRLFIYRLTPYGHTLFILGYTI